MQPTREPVPGQRIDMARLERSRQAQRLLQPEFEVWNPLQFVGQLVRAPATHRGEPELFVGLPDYQLVSLRTGQLWAVEGETRIPIAGSPRVAQKVLDSYPGERAHAYDRLLWAVTAYQTERLRREAAQYLSLNTTRDQELRQVVARTTELPDVGDVIPAAGPAAQSNTRQPALPRLEGAAVLFAALRNRDSARAAELLAHDANLASAQDELGRTALFYALSAQDYELTRRLLESGADANHVDQEGFAVIHDLAKSDDPWPLELLQRYGADLNLGSKHGFTPALIAMRHACWTTLAFLIAEQVNLRTVSRDGASVAVQYQEIEFMPRVIRREIVRQLSRTPLLTSQPAVAPASPTHH